MIEQSTSPSRRDTRPAGSISGSTSSPRPPAAPTQAVSQVRGVLAERVVISTTLDPYLSLKALASYSSLSTRKLREHLADPAHPLPFHRVGGKLLVRRSEFDAWMLAYRQVGRADVDTVVAEVMRDLRAS